MNKKTFLATGGAGFIGSHFVEKAVKKGHRVVVLDALTYAGHRENLDSSWGDWELVEGRIENQALVQSLLKAHQPDAVFHFAAESHVDRSIDGPLVFVETNVLGTANLLSECLEYWKQNGASKSFRFVHISTDEVFGSLGKTGAFHEKTPYAPNSPYSASKAASDHLVRAWSKTYQFPTIITNCSNNYGPRQTPEKLIPRMILRALAGESLPIFGEGKNIRDWIHVHDHVQGIWNAYDSGRPGETYCFGGNSEKQNVELVLFLCQTLDELKPKLNRYELQIEFIEDRAGHDFRYAIDDRKARQDLGFLPNYSFKPGLRDTVSWYLENSKWCDQVSRKVDF